MSSNPTAGSEAKVSDQLRSLADHLDMMHAGVPMPGHNARQVYSAQALLQLCLSVLEENPRAAGSNIKIGRCIFMERIKADVAVHIMSFLDVKAIVRFSATCWPFRRIVQRSDFLWKLVSEEAFPLWFQKTKFMPKPAPQDAATCVWRQMYFERMRADDAWHTGPVTPPLAKRFPRGIHSLYFDNDTLLLGSGQWNEVLSFDLKTGRSQSGANGAGMFGHTGAVTALKPLPNNMLMTSSLDSSLRLFNRTTLQLEKIFAGHTDKVWCVDVLENRVFSGSSDKTIRIWDLETTESACEPLRSHRTSISAIKVVNTLSAPLLFTGSAGNTIRVWDLANGAPRCVEKLRGHTKGVFCLQSTPSVIMSGSLDNVIKVWDPRQGFRLLYDLRMRDANGRELVAYTEETEATNIGVIAFQCDDTKVVSGGPDKKVRIWDLRMRKVVNELEGHNHWITTLQFDDNKIVTGSRDKTVRFWDMTGKMLDSISVGFDDETNGGDVELPPAGHGAALPPPAPQLPPAAGAA